MSICINSCTTLCHFGDQLRGSVCKGGAVSHLSSPRLRPCYGFFGVQDIWVKEYWETGYLGGKLKSSSGLIADTKFKNFMIVNCSFAKITEIAILIKIFCNHTNFTHFEFPSLLY